MAKRELELSRSREELEQPSCSEASWSTKGFGAKRARFSIDTLLEARPSFREPDLSPSFSPDLTADETSKTITVTKTGKSQQSIRGDILDGMECRLEGAELWEKFYELGTEMIITKSGRLVCCFFIAFSSIILFLYAY
ncbi:hypothetical protein DICVIV_06341 [Dictyocaulus viviparus]|uniref:T-box domain-containing protein n=1 Tax=Dictyocaulus viviparus TaxID=29172 RepID=A0A0D8XUY8_DICVI|nr:hypothetical protein DICVIV_06341 [Dictyocaulus viviparus]